MVKIDRVSYYIDIDMANQSFKLKSLFGGAMQKGAIEECMQFKSCLVTYLVFL